MTAESPKLDGPGQPSNRIEIIQPAQVQTEVFGSVVTPLNNQLKQTQFSCSKYPSIENCGFALQLSLSCLSASLDPLMKFFSQ